MTLLRHACGPGRWWHAQRYRWRIVNAGALDWREDRGTGYLSWSSARTLRIVIVTVASLASCELFVLLIAAAGRVLDVPVRTPALMVGAALVALGMAAAAHPGRGCVVGYGMPATDGRQIAAQSRRLRRLAYRCPAGLLPQVAPEVRQLQGRLLVIARQHSAAPWSAAGTGPAAIAAVRTAADALIKVVHHGNGSTCG